MSEIKDVGKASKPFTRLFLSVYEELRSAFNLSHDSLAAKTRQQEGYLRPIRNANWVPTDEHWIDLMVKSFCKLVAEEKESLGDNPEKRLPQIPPLNQWLEAAARQPEDRRPASERYQKQPDAECLDPVGYAFDTLYHTPSETHINAVRLFGANQTFVSAESLEIEYEHKDIELSPALQSRVEEYKRQQLPKPSLKNFNGPNTRLRSFEAGTPTDHIVAVERKTLKLNLGPIPWWTYKALNEKLLIDEVKGIDAPLREYNYYTGLERIVSHRDVSHCLLSNIMSTATTILTNDGRVAYSRRGPDVTQPNKYTSAVAENINRYWDDTPSNCFTARINQGTFFKEKYLKSPKARYARDTNYKPKGVPHPFAAVMRGVEEEISPEVVERVDPQSLKLIGLCFDLVAGHPDALFLLPVPLSHKQVFDAWRTRPGKDFHEGKPLFVPADLGRKETQKILAQSAEWIPGGQASLFRSLEFIREVGGWEKLK